MGLGPFERRSRTVFAVAATLGVLVSVGVAVVAGLGAVSHPINESPYDLLWFRFYVAVFVLIFFGATLWRGKALIAATAATLAVFIALTIVAGGFGPAIAMFVWIAIAATALGSWFVSALLPASTATRLERTLLSLALGLGLLALIVLALGLLHLLYPTITYGTLALITVLLVPRLIRPLRGAFSELTARARTVWQTTDLRFASIVFACIVVCLWGGLIWAFAPTIQFDALVYHLSVPSLYVQQHGIVQVQEEFRSNWAHYGEMLFTLGLETAGQPLPELMHFAYCVMTALLTFTLGQRLGGLRTGLVSAVLYVSVPIVTWESGIAYIDLIVAFYAFASLYAVVVWWIDDQDRWLVAGGILGGLALGSKLNAAIVILPVALFLTVALLLRRGLSRRSLLGICAFGLPAILLFAPWLWRDWLWTGSPIFPYFNTVFRSPDWPLQDTFFNFGSFGVGHGPVDFARMPWDLVVRTSAYSEVTPVGSLGALPLTALPWSLPLFSSRLRRSVLVLLGLGLAALVLWFKIAQYSRYVLVIVPLFAVLSALNLDAVWQELSAQRLGKLAVALSLLAALVYLPTTRFVSVLWNWQIPERYPYEVAFGVTSPAQFLSQYLPVYDALQYVDRAGDGEHKVLSIGNEFRMYTRSRIFGLSGSRAAQLAASALPEPTRSADLIHQGFDYLLVDENQVHASPAQYRLSVLDQTFLDDYTRLEFARHGINVYRLAPSRLSASPAQSENQLTNGSFEELGSDGLPNGWFAYGKPVIDRTGANAHSGIVGIRADENDGMYQRIVVTPGKVYTLGHWTRADQPKQTARLQINWLDANMKIIDVSLTPVPAGEEWTWHQMSATAPDGAVLAQVYVSVHENSHVWFDDVVLQGGTNP
ncbi:MAG: glycosyltransferase family 39 protein [Chloroflexi bacterium]|nr:glycosyltransferase family 39 protein [Chloroflexota bacterium]